MEKKDSRESYMRGCGRHPKTGNRIHFLNPNWSEDFDHIREVLEPYVNHGKILEFTFRNVVKYIDQIVDGKITMEEGLQIISNLLGSGNMIGRIALKLVMRKITPMIEEYVENATPHTPED